MRENAKDDQYHSIKQNPWCEHENKHLEQITFKKDRTICKTNQTQQKPLVNSIDQGGQIRADC